MTVQQDGTARAWYAATGIPTLWRTAGSRPTPSARHVRCIGSPPWLLRPTAQHLWSWSDAVGDVAFDLDTSGEVRVTDRDGVVAQHAPFASGWRITASAPDSHRDTIVLCVPRRAELLRSWSLQAICTLHPYSPYS